LLKDNQDEKRKTLLIESIYKTLELFEFKKTKKMCCFFLVNNCQSFGNCEVLSKPVV